jgi:hypothetical protein
MNPEVFREYYVRGVIGKDRPLLHIFFSRRIFNTA